MLKSTHNILYVHYRIDVRLSYIYAEYTHINVQGKKMYDKVIALVYWFSEKKEILPFTMKMLVWLGPKNTNTQIYEVLPQNWF